MTYSPFDALDPYSDEYATNDNSIGNTNTIKKSFDRKDPFAHLDAGPLVAKPQAVTKPEVVEPIKPENDSPNSAVTDFIQGMKILSLERSIEVRLNGQLH